MTGPILVVGATGIQGGGVIKAITAHDKHILVHALVRDPASHAAQALTTLGPQVKIFTGNFDDVDSILRVAKGCTAAFLNVTPVFTDPTGEARHASNQIEACKLTTSIKRVVYSSSAAMHPPNDRAFSGYLPKNPTSWMGLYLTSKKACEEAITATTSPGISDGWCIIRGSTFFTNFLPPHALFMYPTLATDQTITTALSPSLKISFLDPGDLCKLAAKMLLSDDTTWSNSWKGKYVPIAKDNFTFKKIVDAANATLRNAGTAKQINLVEIPETEAKERAAKGDIVIDSQLYQNEYMHSYDLQEVKNYGIDVDGMTSPEDFFEREKEKLLAVVGGK